MSYSRKVERLIESKKPSLSILLEETGKDDKKNLKKKPEKSESSAKGPEKASKSSSSSNPDEKKDDNFDFGSFDFGDEKDDKEENFELGDDQKSEEPEEDKEDKDSEQDKEEAEKEIEDKIKSKLEKVNNAIYDPLNLAQELDRKLFPESFFRKVGIASSFKLQEKKIFMTNKKVLKEFSINDKVGDIDLSIDVLVSNAINLTKNFDNLIDIPDLILSHVSARFAEKAIDDDDDNAGSEYRVKLEEFIEKYMHKLKSIDDYKNYDTSKYVISHNPQRPVATGARPST
jgi:hypothetical protein